MIILSPSKKLDFESKVKDNFESSIPVYTSEAEKLIAVLKKFSVKQVANLMDLSDKLAELNFNRYHSFVSKPSNDNAKPAIFAFVGDVYDGFKVNNLTKEQVEYANSHLRILSGLYGLLKPLDLLQPYRLEMGTRLKTDRGQNLYSFWGEKITEQLQRDLIAATPENKVIYNLASNEYSKSVKFKGFDANVIDFEFKELKNGKYKAIMLFAKKARGMMASYIIRNKIESPEQLRGFAEDGYRFNEELSSPKKFVFTRESANAFKL